MRGANPPTEIIKSYADRLAREQVVDVINALLKIQELQRGEGELAFPSIGTILSMTAVERRSRYNRDMGCGTKELVSYRCPSCSAIFDVFEKLGAHPQRTCSVVCWDGVIAGCRTPLEVTGRRAV